MSEQYASAASRHYLVGELLRDKAHVDDAAYHFGVCGENAVKFGLQVTGVEAFWNAAARPVQATPMRGHFYDLHQKIIAAQADIALNATGRHAAAVVSTVLSPTFVTMFQGWSINIRYADTSCTPVSSADCDRWADEAADLMLKIVLQ